MMAILARLTLVLLALGTAGTILSGSLRRRSAPGDLSLVAFALSLALWAACGVLYLYHISPSQVLWRGVALLGVTVLPAALFTFALVSTDRGRWLTWRIAALLALEPLLTQVVYWNPAWREVLFNLKKMGAAEVIPSSGLWFLGNTIYSSALLLIAIYWLFQTYRRSSLPYRFRSGALLAGAVVPVLTGLIGWADLAPLHLSVSLLIAYTFTGLVLTYDYFRYKLPGFVPIERALVVERMSDGWMVLDRQNRIVDMNPAASLIVGHPRQKIIGQPAESVLSNWRNLIQNDNARELELRGSVNMGGEWRYFNVRITPLADQQGYDIGKIVLWRDLTERRRADEARQRAREEMFTLLHSISGAASRALSVNDFLAESIHQIAYSFHSQSSVTFLVDETEEESEGTRLLLAAHTGFPGEAEDRLWPVLESTGVIAQIVRTQDPLSIPDVSVEVLFPNSIRQLGSVSLLVVPMAMEGRVLGVIGLARKGDSEYSPDEVARLTVVAEEVAMLIHSDRQRQISIAVAERQRLVRDLHDSVTQKLYGLVTLTEAAQAGLDVGSTYEPAQVLARIGEYARQALKEMRLFLYELQPVDLETQGLVAVLHHRLAAVEGRSDVKARLIADDKISLSLEKEVALYFIAQEALNNILRHASAKSVTVRLKQRRVNVSLEIEDDGCGFDLQQADKGGLGLGNMRERAMQIGGKLKITSDPEKGTRVTVTVRRDKRR
jgi:PAS domain S-box-containing protein